MSLIYGAALFDLTALTSVIVGLAAWTSNYGSLEMIYWARIRIKEYNAANVLISEALLFLGLRGFGVEPIVADDDSTDFDTYKSCVLDACEKCKDNGVVVLGLYIVAVVLIAASVAISATRLSKPSLVLKQANMGLSFVSFTLIIAGLINITTNCIHADFTNGLTSPGFTAHGTYHYGPAWGLAVAAAASTGLSFIIQAFTPDA